MSDFTLDITAYIHSIVDGEMDKIRDRQEEAKKNVLKQIINDTDKYIPYKSGTLANTVSTLPTNDGIIYPVKYASHAFNPLTKSGAEKNYTLNTHPLATGNPFEVSAEENSDRWAELYAEELMKYE